MQRSSESIGAIASALAKAQSELTNPEKSLVATIRSPFPEGERPDVSLCVALQRARHRPQNAWQARDRDRADDRNRQRGGTHSSDDRIWLIPRVNGCRRTGRCARSAKQ